jgi:hypothetical protein
MEKYAVEQEMARSQFEDEKILEGSMSSNAKVGLRNLQDGSRGLALCVKGILPWGAVLCLALCFAAAHAQSGIGPCRGKVTDTSGDVIPEVMVDIVTQPTGVASDTNRKCFENIPGAASHELTGIRKHMNTA